MNRAWVGALATIALEPLPRPETKGRVAVRSFSTTVLEPALEIEGVLMPSADATIFFPFGNNGIDVIEEA